MKEKNSLKALLFPGFFGIVYALLCGALTYYLNFFSFLVIITSYIIGHMMLKYLYYYTVFHKVLAAFYGLIAFLFFYQMIYFINFLDNGYDFLMSLKTIFSFSFLKVLIRSFHFFDWVMLVIIPVSAYAYLEARGKR